MMRAPRILDSPYAPLSVFLATFRIICCPFLVFGAGAKPVLLSKQEQPLPRLVAPA